MANPDVATLMAKVATSSYADRFREIWGKDVFADTQLAYAKPAARR